MRKRAFVRDVNDMGVNVVVIRESACGGNCASCGTCESKPIDLNIKTDRKYNVGDIVDLEISSKDYMKLTVLMYLLPLIAFIIGFFGSQYIFSTYINMENELLSVVVGVFFMILAFAFAKGVDNKVKDKNIIKIVWGGNGIFKFKKSRQ